MPHNSITQKISLFWFRRDLRLDDNCGLFKALNGGCPVLPIFIFDTEILSKLEDKADRRVDFIHRCIGNLQTQLNSRGSTLHVLHSDPATAFRELIATYPVAAVYTNHDYEPEAIKRDEQIRIMLAASGIPLYTFKDQVIFEQNEILKDNGTPYTVFTPYSRKWKEKLSLTQLPQYDTEKHFQNFVRLSPIAIPSLADIGFLPADLKQSLPELNRTIAIDYDKTRDFPALTGTTRLSVHLRFGTISIRKLVKEVTSLNPILLNELIWREFYMMILYLFPHVAEHSFKPQYDRIMWRNNEAEFRLWCEGRTGYPIVDAGMRELNLTGYMHNRVRMITASFLTKHLLIDWRWGAHYFATKLLDYDLAANNGGWQWAAGSGCDAAPYFRVFNPSLQTAKFDPKLEYVRRWVPEVDELTYPQPMVVHELARKRCLETYKRFLNPEI